MLKKQDRYVVAVVGATGAVGTEMVVTLEQRDFPVAEQYYKNCISLPMFPTLTEEEQKYVIDSVIEYYHE